MKLTLSSSAEAVKDIGNASYIGANGVYDVVINFVSVEATKNGAKQANFNVLYNGNTQALYGPTIVNKDGSPNSIGMSLLNKLGVIVGMTEGGDLTIVEETHKVGKDKVSKTFEVITDFSGAPVKLRIQREYTRYNGAIQRSLLIRNIFRPDGATAAEIIDGAEPGKQLALELAKYTDQSSYKDAVTPEEAEQWETAQRDAKKGASSVPVSQVAVKRAGMFGTP